jgi:hypothetical protein
VRALLLALAAATLVGCHSTSSESSDAGCEQLLEEAANALAPAVAERSCTKNSDCVIASSRPACGSSYYCGVVVNQAGAAALDAAVAQVNATTCATFAAEGCVAPLLPLPPCLPLTGPYCVAGACSGFPGPDDDAGADAGSGSTDAASD